MEENVHPPAAKISKNISCQFNSHKPIEHQKQSLNTWCYSCLIFAIIKEQLNHLDEKPKQ